MKYFNKNFLFAAVVSITFLGCDKYLDINNDPNRVNDTNITPELLFTGAEVAVGDLAVGSSAAGAGTNSPLQFAYNWVGYMAQNGQFAPIQSEITYNISYNFGNQLWLNYFATLYDLYKAKTLALAGNDKVLAGAAMILSAKLYQEVVDIYGDAPYKEAFQLLTYPQPKYDKATDIYGFLQKSLDSAITYMAAEPTSVFETVDVINHGDQDMWIKFANTLKLRLLIRQSEVSGFNPSAEIANIMNNGGGLLGAGESISVNPVYTNDVNKQSPFYSHYGFTPTGVRATTSTNANSYIIDLLDATADPRIERFFTAVSGNFIGNPYGSPQDEAGSSTGTSYFGPGLIGNTNQLGAAQDQWIFPSFESLFLQAEAIARGWMPGNAENAYNNAVQESFIWLGVPDAVSAANDYIGGGSGISDWADAGPTPLEKAKFIAVQKYIANCCIDPLESWSDIRRLNMLADIDEALGESYISIASGRVGPGTIPVRLFYAQSELSSNGPNVPTGTTQFAPKIFWQP